jgi:hypothetical protein
MGHQSIPAPGVPQNNNGNQQRSAQQRRGENEDNDWDLLFDSKQETARTERVLPDIQVQARFYTIRQ